MFLNITNHRVISIKILNYKLNYVTSSYVLIIPIIIMKNNTLILSHLFVVVDENLLDL